MACPSEQRSPSSPLPDILKRQMPRTRCPQGRRVFRFLSADELELAGATCEFKWRFVHCMKTRRHDGTKATKNVDARENGGELAQPAALAFSRIATALSLHALDITNGEYRVDGPKD